MIESVHEDVKMRGVYRMAYVTFDEMQEILIDYYRQYGVPLDYPEACARAVELGYIHREEPQFDRGTMLSVLSDSEFERLLHSYPLGIMNEAPVWRSAPKPDLLNDIYALQHLYNPGSAEHAPNRFRVFYAYKGNFDMYFEKKHTQMETGDLAIVAPGCRAIAYMPQSSIVLQLGIQPTCFDTTFNKLTSESNVISSFLRSVLYSENRINYLLFHTENDGILKACFKSFFLQQLNHDAFTASAMQHTLGTLLTHLLRFYSTRISYYHQNEQVNAAMVLTYLQNNWRTLTLTRLAGMFGYNENYLSVVIRKETGMTYTAMITQLRMAEAARLMQTGSMKISEIAEAVGCNSPEHFSRSFRAFYGVSPADYRRRIQGSAESGADVSSEY